MIADKKLPFAKTATQVVFGEGSLNPKIYFLGEAPGRKEDETGRPFVGRSGQFLRGMIHKIGLKEKDVYITSVVRFRPPENRTPTPKEVEKYKKYVDAELEIIKPKVIVTLGAVSLRKFTDQPIGKVHAKITPIVWNGRQIILFPSYHPAAALRGNSLRQQFIKDFGKLKQFV